MKRINHALIRFIFIIPILIFLITCKKEALLSDIQDQYKVTIAYDFETLSFIGLPNAASENDPVSILTKEPKLNRSSVKIGIYSDGNCQIEITNCQPKNTFRIPFEVLPNPNPQPYKLIMAGGYALTYDKSDSILNKIPSKMPNFKEFLNVIKRNNNQLTRNIYSTYLANLKQSNLGKSTETFRDDGNFLIYEDFLSADDGVNQPFIGKKVTTWFDKETNDLRGQAISDESEQVKYMIQFGYEDNTSGFFPSFTKEESYEEKISGEDYVITTYTDYDNVDIRINL
jgi:hypothetical protein